MFGKNKSVSNTAASSGVFLEIDGSRPGTPSSQEESSSVKKKKRFSLFGNKNDTAIKNLEYVKERDAGTLNSLSKAICTNNIEKVKNILDIKKPNINDKDKTFKRNSIHWAAIQKTSIFMKLLMEYKNKKEPSDYEALDSCGQTPLCLAVIQKHTEIIRMLAPISKKSIDLLDKFGKNCLMYAVDNDDQFTSSVLLKHGANVNVKFHNGEAPLLVYAIKNRKTSSALELINWGADLNLVDEYERSPLYYAIQNQDVHLVKALVERGADTRQQDQQGESPQELSKKIKNKEFPEGKKENQDSPSIIIQNYVIYGTAKPSKINDHRSRSLDKIDMTPNKGASTPLSDGESPVITPALSKKSIKNGLSAEPSFELSPLSGSKDIEEVTELTESNDSVNTFGMVEKESPIKKITEEFDISDMSINNVVEDNIRDFGLRTPVEVAPVVCPSKSPSVLENFRKQCTRSAPLRDSSGELFYESDIIKAKSLGNTVKSKSFDKKRMISSEQEENDSNKLADSPLNRAKSARYPVRENVHLSLKKLPHLKITGASNPEMAADSAIQKESPLSAKEFRKKEIDMILKSLNEVRNETDQEEIVINPLIDPKRRVSVDILSPILKNRGSLKGEEKLVNGIFYYDCRFKNIKLDTFRSW
jgi:ankyrin repeat protein